AAQIFQAPIAVAVYGANRQHFAELVIGNRQRKPRAPGVAVLDAAQADVEVAARRGCVDRRETNLDEARRAPETGGKQLRDLDVPSAAGMPLSMRNENCSGGDASTNLTSSLATRSAPRIGPSGATNSPALSKSASTWGAHIFSSAAA